MKIETEIPDINREEVIEAMARQLLGEWHEEVEHDVNASYMRHYPTKLGAAMKKYLDDKIEGLAQTLVREKFDQVIQDRIAAAVDAVLKEGWVKTDEYGSARGPAMDLKGRISEYLNHHDRYSSGGKRIEGIVKEHVEKTLSGELRKEVDAAVASLRAQLNAAVSNKFVEAIKAAMGVR